MTRRQEALWIFSLLLQVLLILYSSARLKLGRGWQRLEAIQLPLQPLQWILLVYFVCGGLYLFATPPFEANEERLHFGYIQHLRQTASLPVLPAAGEASLYAQHGGQPPLYYLLMAVLSTPIDLEDAESYRQLNPHLLAKQPDAFGNKNILLPDEAQTRLRGVGLALLQVRVLGLLMGALTIRIVAAIGRIIAPRRPLVAVVAAALTGLNPMFLFISASANNDSLSMLLNGALMLLLLRSLRTGFKRRRSIAIALLFALSCLTKLTGILLLPMILALAAFIWRKTQDRGGLQTLLGALLLAWLLLAGWWFLRNLQLYGEPLGLLQMAELAGIGSPRFSLATLLGDFQLFRMSYWGVFGALNIQFGSSLYILLDVLVCFGISGYIFLVLQLWAISDFAYARYELSQLLSLGAAMLLLTVAICLWGGLSSASDGRMLFPLIAVVSPLLAVGLVEMVWWLLFSMFPRSLQFVRAGEAVSQSLLERALRWQLVLLGLLALLAPLTVIASQYQIPQAIAAVPPNAQAVYAQFGDVALIAYEAAKRRYHPGDKLRLTLYWQVLAQAPQDYSVRLSLVDDRMQVLGRSLSYPGGGRLRSSRWQAGAIYPDETVIALDEAAYGRYPLRLQIHWQNAAGDLHLPATDMAGLDIAPVTLDMGAVVSARFRPEIPSSNILPADAQPKFDDVIRLESFQVDLEFNGLILHWKADASPEEDYTVFAHLLGDNGEILAQADTPPRLPTKYWRWGESYSTSHFFFPEELALHEHEVVVGLYLNDGLSYPKAEYLVEDIEEDLAATMPPDTGEIIDLPTAAEVADTQRRDSFRIPWDAAKEVRALTETPAPDSTFSATESVDVNDGGRTPSTGR